MKCLEASEKYITHRKKSRESNKIPKDRKVLMRKRKRLQCRLLNERKNKNREKINYSICETEKKLMKSHEEETLRNEEVAISAIKDNNKYIF